MLHPRTAILCLALTTLGAVEPSWPAAPGAVFAARNVHFATPVIAADARGRRLTAVEFIPRGRALNGRFYDLLCDGGSFVLRDAGAWIGTQVAKSGAFSVEAAIIPAGGDGTVLAYGGDRTEAFALVQSRGSLHLRSGSGEIPLFPIETGRRTHVLVSAGPAGFAAYRDGALAADGALPAAAAAAWPAGQLVVGATPAAAEPWHGRVEGLAVFARPLTTAEVVAESSRIRALTANRPAAAPLRFRGTLLRQAETSDPKAILPYHRSLTAAEYRIDAVLSGAWDAAKEPTITVFHWMIIDHQRLPLAERKAGATEELTVEPLDDHEQLENERRDDIPGRPATAPTWYCETEPSP